MIDPPTFLLLHDAQVCGIGFPYYKGKFVPLTDARFGLADQQIDLLESNGVKVDNFSHRNNGVILENGHKKIIDLSYARSKLG